MLVGLAYHIIIHIYCCGKQAALSQANALFAWIIPTMTPKIPNAEAKISTTKILTNNEPSWASAKAQLDPATPTLIPL